MAFVCSDEFREAVKKEIARTHPTARGTAAQMDVLLDSLTENILKEWMNSHLTTVEKAKAEAANQAAGAVQSKIDARKYADESKRYAIEAKQTSRNISSEIDTLRKEREAAGGSPETAAIINLYRQLVEIGKNAGADGNCATREAAYIMWAKLSNGTITAAEFIHDAQKGDNQGDNLNMPKVGKREPRL